MTPERIDRLKSNFAQISASRVRLAARFYQELFTAAPALRPLFPAT
jgi:hemoglobin-like flavoprotein